MELCTLLKADVFPAVFVPMRFATPSHTEPFGPVFDLHSCKPAQDLE